MCQMAQMAQMAGQMGGMMPMGMMAPMGGMMPMQMMPMAQTDKDGESFLELSEEELGERIASQAAEVKEAEKVAKDKAMSGTFVGTLARYDPELGFGFVICPECVQSWGKSDIYIGQKNFLESGLEVGDVVSFQVEDNNGKPRVAMNPRILKEVTRLKKKLTRLKEAAKAVNSSNKRSAGAMANLGGDNLM